MLPANTDDIMPEPGYIDAHQHFWKFDPVRDSWIDESMWVIQRDFLAGDLEPVLQQLGFSGSVVVQSDQSEKENMFQLKNAGTNPFVKGIVGWVDLQSATVEKRLEYYSHFPLMKGFRHVLQGEGRRNLMLDPAFMHGVSLLERFNFSYDILIYPDQLQYIPTFVKAFPNQRFVIDHLAKPLIKTKQIAEWTTAIEAVAAHDNVYCKVSGMVTEADWHHWKAEDFNPYLEVVTEAFGTKRIMFGSDWPVCLVAGTYSDVVGLVKKYYAKFSHDEQQLIFGDNARAFYNLA